MCSRFEMRVFFFLFEIQQVDQCVRNRVSKGNGGMKFSLRGSKWPV